MRGYCERSSISHSVRRGGAPIRASLMAPGRYSAQLRNCTKASTGNSGQRKEKHDDCPRLAQGREEDAPRLRDAGNAIRPRAARSLRASARERQMAWNASETLE